MRLLTVILLTVLAFTAGCASAPSLDEQASADYGAPVAQAEAEQAVRAYMERRLRDPYSAVYSFGTVQKGYVEAAPLVGQKMAFGYLLDASINAKNAMGGYSGTKRYQFLFRDGAITAASGEECLSGGGCYMAPLK